MTDAAVDLAVRMVAGALRPDDESTSVELPLEVGALVELVYALVMVGARLAGRAMALNFMCDHVPVDVMAIAGDDAVRDDRSRADWAAKSRSVVGELRWSPGRGAVPGTGAELTQTRGVMAPGSSRTRRPSAS